MRPLIQAAIIRAACVYVYWASSVSFLRRDFLFVSSEKGNQKDGRQEGISRKGEAGAAKKAERNKRFTSELSVSTGRRQVNTKWCCCVTFDDHCLSPISLLLLITICSLTRFIQVSLSWLENPHIHYIFHSMTEDWQVMKRMEKKEGFLSHFIPPFPKQVQQQNVTQMHKECMPCPMITHTRWWSRLFLCIL